MARKLRVEYPGAIYHVMNRGDHREAIYCAAADRKRFLTTLAVACTKTGWQIQAYCLTGNHFHLVVETPKANLVAGMKVSLAAKLRAETTVTLGWISERLRMGTRGHLTHLLYHQARTDRLDTTRPQLWK